MWIADYIGTYIIIAPFLILAAVGYWKLFEKAGKSGWAAFIPFYSTWVMLKISGRPAWWIIWLFIPLANYVFTIGIFIDFIRSYGKFALREQLAGIILAFIYLPKWGFEKRTVYMGPSASDEFKQEHRIYGRSPVYSRWAITLGLLLGIVLFIRAFILSTYVIPTASMERTLLKGDYIILSKISYGARLPITPVADPYSGAHLGHSPIKAYWGAIQWPYHRLPGFGQVQRGDIIVFNYPLDTLDNPPVDEQETYMKRCEGVPGDTVYAAGAQQFVNGKPCVNVPGQQMDYTVISKGNSVNPQLFKQLHISHYYDSDSIATMTAASANALKQYSNIVSVLPYIFKKGISDTLNAVFPAYLPIPLTLNGKIHDYKWNIDNYGPIIIPKRGWTVKLDSLTFPLYERCISVYERNTVQVNSNNIFINGVKTNAYTFKMNYYWVIGDNLHDSEDSRYWGFVPEDHIVGKAVMIYMSWDTDAPFFSKMRWERMFTLIH
jgi:signal peptidase I